MRKELVGLVVVAAGLALSREQSAFIAAGAALMFMVAGGYSRRTHF